MLEQQREAGFNQYEGSKMVPGKSITMDDCGPALLRKQRSHVLFVLSNPKTGCDSAFLRWYQGAYRQAILDSKGVLSVQHYEQHDVDITRGRHVRLPFRYLGISELSLDGAQEAERLLELITSMHIDEAAAQPPATWLYYPVSEKVGRSATLAPSMLTVAFANGVPGQEAEFREWYATRHIRHALKIPALVSGQCFERTCFQRPGAMEANFSLIAIYEQEDTPEAILGSFASLPEGALHFPMLDRTPSRFAEWVYRPVRAGNPTAALFRQTQ